jgi:hypothetical protein
MILSGTMVGVQGDVATIHYEGLLIQIPFNEVICAT